MLFKDVPVGQRFDSFGERFVKTIFFGTNDIDGSNSIRLCHGTQPAPGLPSLFEDFEEVDLVRDSRSAFLDREIWKENQLLEEKSEVL